MKASVAPAWNGVRSVLRSEERLGETRFCRPTIVTMLDLKPVEGKH